MVLPDTVLGSPFFLLGEAEDPVTKQSEAGDPIRVVRPKKAPFFLLLLLQACQRTHAALDDSYTKYPPISASSKVSTNQREFLSIHQRGYLSTHQSARVPTRGLLYSYYYRYSLNPFSTEKMTGH